MQFESQNEYFIFYILFYIQWKFIWNKPLVDFFYNQSQKYWNNSIKHNLLGFSLKNIIVSSIKTPFPSTISMLCVSNLSTAWSWCNFQNHQYYSKGERSKPLQKVVASINFVTGCRSWFTIWNKWIISWCVKISWCHLPTLLGPIILKYFLSSSHIREIWIALKLSLVEHYSWSSLSLRFCFHWF